MIVYVKIHEDKSEIINSYLCNDISDLSFLQSNFCLLFVIIYHLSPSERANVLRIHVNYFLPSFPQMTDAIIYTDTRGDKIRDCRSFLISLNFWVTWLLIPEFFATKKLSSSNDEVCGPAQMSASIKGFAC